MTTDTREALAALQPSKVAAIIQRAWDDNAPDVMCFGLAVASRIEAACAALATQPAQPSDELSVRAVEELLQLGYTVKDDLLYPPTEEQMPKELLDGGVDPAVIADYKHWVATRPSNWRELSAAQPSAQGEAVARELLNRMLEAPTTHIRASWKDAIREALLKTSPTESVAWLVEWKANGHGPQWWGFNHTPGKNASWCSDSNNAIRFARKEDAERMRLHIIAVAGLTGVHDYERSVSVTEHMWEGPCRAE